MPSDETAASGAAAFQSLSLPLAVLGDGARIVLVNAATEMLLTGPAAIAERRKDAFALRERGADEQLRLLVGGALRGGTGGAMRVRAGQAEFALIVECLADPRDAARRVLLTARRLDAARVPASRLRALFALSVAEADIATSLAAGRSVGEIAAERGRSVGTVRKQVRHILAKTDAADLRALTRKLGELG